MRKDIYLFQQKISQVGMDLLLYFQHPKESLFHEKFLRTHRLPIFLRSYLDKPITLIFPYVCILTILKPLSEAKASNALNIFFLCWFATKFSNKDLQKKGYKAQN